MPYLRDLPAALRAGGCHVWEDPDADNRGQGALVSLRQLFLHHTAGGGSQDWLVVRDGRKGLQGLLSQLTLERNGVFRYLGAGQAWHAGTGGPSKYIPAGQGNSRGLGIEIVSKGCWDCFTNEQKTEIVKGVAALIRWYHLPADAFLAHKEWTSRKIDPAFDMAWIRREVGRLLAGAGPTGEDTMPGWYEPKRRDWAGNEQDLNSSLDILDQRLVHIERRINETATAILGLHDRLMERIDETHPQGTGSEETPTTPNP